jgi:hypothetical protein
MIRSTDLARKPARATETGISASFFDTADKA